MKLEWTNNPGLVSGPLVYVAYPAEGSRPLYIGMSEDLINRLSQHRNKKPRKPWYWEIDLVVITTFNTTAEAFDHERDLIRNLNPIHNIERYQEVGA